jgi:hypothetical protein
MVSGGAARRQRLHAFDPPIQVLQVPLIAGRQPQIYPALAFLNRRHPDPGPPRRTGYHACTEPVHKVPSPEHREHPNHPDRHDGRQGRGAEAKSQRQMDGIGGQIYYYVTQLQTHIGKDKSLKQDIDHRPKLQFTHPQAIGQGRGL